VGGEPGVTWWKGAVCTTLASERSRVDFTGYHRDGSVPHGKNGHRQPDLANRKLAEVCGSRAGLFTDSQESERVRDGKQEHQQHECEHKRELESKQEQAREQAQESESK